MIKVFDNAIDGAFCDALIERFNKHTDMHVPGHTANGVLTHVKKSVDLRVPWEWSDVVSVFRKSSDEMLADVDPERMFSYAFRGMTHPQIQHYKAGDGFYVFHNDEAGEPRQVALIWYLNDVDEGGETEFYYHGNIAVKPKKGRALLMPIGWSFTHRGNVPISGDKYIVTSFILNAI